MNTTTGKINVGDIFKKTLAAVLGTIGQTIIQETSKVKVVQREIENQKTSAGKNMLWKYFPYAILLGIGIFAMSKVK